MQGIPLDFLEEACRMMIFSILMRMRLDSSSLRLLHREDSQFLPDQDPKALE